MPLLCYYYRTSSYTRIVAVERPPIPPRLRSEWTKVGSRGYFALFLYVLQTIRAITRRVLLPIRVDSLRVFLICIDRGYFPL